MTTDYESGWTGRSRDRTWAIEGRPFETEGPTPCRTAENTELWFSPFKDRVHAVRQCKACPFIGRCGYNAIISRAKYGVWGGVSLPGDRSTCDDLENAYTFLLAQFERRRQIEIGDLQVPIPSTSIRRRDAAGAGVFDDDDEFDSDTDTPDVDELDDIADLDLDDVDFGDTDFDDYAATA